VPGHQKGAARIDPENRVPQFRFHQIDRGVARHRLRPRVGGVVVQNVQLAEAAQNVGAQGRNAGFVGKIQVKGGRLPAIGADTGGHLLGAVPIDIGERDFCAFPHKPMRRGGPDAAAAARDQGDFSIKSLHYFRSL
jgi:hypothetical protein